MKPTLTWLDLTSSDRTRMQRVLDLFTEQGTIDELGQHGYPSSVGLEPTKDSVASSSGDRLGTEVA